MLAVVVASVSIVRLAQAIELQAELRAVPGVRGRVVQAGVPLPRAWAREAAALQVREGAQVLPAQVDVRARWPDGSLRWIWVDWLTQKPQTGKQVFELEGKPGVKAEPQSGLPRVRVEEDPGGIMVDTGPLRVRLPRDRDVWFEILPPLASKLSNPRVLSHLRFNGHDHRAQRPRTLRVLERGPVRARIERQGQYGDGSIRYTVRVDFFAGQPLVRVFHTFEVHADLPGGQLERLTVELPTPRGSPVRLRAGRVGDGPWQKELHRAPVWLAQMDRDRVTLAEQAYSGSLEGRFVAASRHAAVGLAAWDFWQQFPQGVGWLGDRLVYDLYARQAQPALAGTGSAKTHEFMLFFLSEPPAGTWLPDLAAVPLARVNADWFATSEAMRNALDARSEKAKAFLAKLSRAYEDVLSTVDREEWEERSVAECLPEGDPHIGRRRRGFYGMWNWGDWNFPGYRDSVKGCDAWGNLEYDLPQVLALAYAATGSGNFLDGLIASARHFMDVDRIHAQPRFPQWVGMNHPKNPLHWSFAKGGVDLGHTWTEGLLSYFFLTGDERGLEAARGIGEFLLRRLRAGVKGNPRQFGWPQIALIALYEATLDERYRAAAVEYARQGMQKHQPDKIEDWKLGIFAEGLVYVHTVTHDPEIWSWLERYTRKVLAREAPMDSRFWPGVAYVVALANDSAGVGRVQQFLDSLEFGRWAKPFTIQSRVGFAILWYFRHSERRAQP